MSEPQETPEVIDPKAAWDGAADAWDAFVEGGADYHRTEVHGPALIDLCGQVTGLRVLDVGCGQGWLARQLARAGATVTGIDLAPRMLAHARRHEANDPLGITYVELDAADAAQHWSSGSFDLVTACMVLHDLPHADAVLSSARQVLGVSGRVVFSIPHPVSHPRVHQWMRDEEGRKIIFTIDCYFESGPITVAWNMARLTAHWDATRWHRTLSEWSEIFCSAGLRIRRMAEPCPTPEQIVRIPKFESSARIPTFLIFELEPGDKTVEHPAPDASTPDRA